GEDSLPRSCRHLAFEYLMRGRSLLGERCWDGMCAIDYLCNRPDVQPGVLGCTGHSGGGCTALWLAALDSRITTTVVSGYFCSFKDSVLAMPHCECNYVPGVLDLVEMGDLAALIAPRPFCVVHGARDPIFPVPATVAQFGTVKRAYQLHDKVEACSLAIHGGAHAYDHRLSQAWFVQWL
ncbi:MAG TPA: acetylxylan esterase, partial [Anaerolineae bacterium]|nr:acetylxylan esterase [Anaerolineae bacterium]